LERRNTRQKAIKNVPSEQASMRQKGEEKGKGDGWRKKKRKGSGRVTSGRERVARWGKAKDKRVERKLMRIDRKEQQEKKQSQPEEKKRGSWRVNPERDAKRGTSKHNVKDGGRKGKLPVWGRQRCINSKLLGNKWGGRDCRQLPEKKLNSIL